MTDLSEASLTAALASFSPDECIALRPTKLLIQPYLLKLAIKVLRGPHWHHKTSPRWRYLQRRGARP